MEKIKCIYIIYFILQVISIPVIGFLLFPMSQSTVYHSFYCEIHAKKVDESYWKEFRKLFPTDYNHYCGEIAFEGVLLYVFSFFCSIILFFILISYIVNLCLKINNGLILE